MKLSAPELKNPDKPYPLLSGILPTAFSDVVWGIPGICGGAVDTSFKIAISLPLIKSPSQSGWAFDFVGSASIAITMNSESPSKIAEPDIKT